MWGLACDVRGSPVPNSHFGELLRAVTTPVVRQGRPLAMGFQMTPIPTYTLGDWDGAASAAPPSPLPELMLK